MATSQHISQYLSQQHEQLGSIIEIKLPKTHASYFDACFAEIDRIEKTYSRFLDTSELSLVNKHLGKWQTVSEEFLRLVKCGVEFNKETTGCFDITLKADLDRLGYDKNYSFTPKEEVAGQEKRKFGFGPGLGLKKRLLPLVPALSRHPIRIRGNKILLRKEIEFGGLGKGYALDCVAAILNSANVPSYYINAGGDILVRGTWDILLEHPDDSERAIGKVSLKDCAIAGSAPNRRKWKEYHHLLNARTGMPEQSVLCVFTIAKTGLAADVYATSIFTAGFDDGIKLSRKLPVETLIVSAERKMFKSDGFNAEFYT